MSLLYGLVLIPYVWFLTIAQTPRYALVGGGMTLFALFLIHLIVEGGR